MNAKVKGAWRSIPRCEKQSLPSSPANDDTGKNNKNKNNKNNKQKNDDTATSVGDFDSISARILGGTKVATNGEYPWQCLLITSAGSFCGCVVIDERLILTAAHCVLTASEK